MFMINSNSMFIMIVLIILSIHLYVSIIYIEPVHNTSDIIIQTIDSTKVVDIIKEDVYYGTFKQEHDISVCRIALVKDSTNYISMFISFIKDKEPVYLLIDLTGTRY